MEITSHIENTILFADGKALATTGKHGLNVVPVSTVRIMDGKILFMNYFFDKTRDNVMTLPRAALACWKGFEGYQIKGSVEYLEAGPLFDETEVWVKKNIPNRTLKGVLILSPEEIFEVTPGKAGLLQKHTL